MGNPSFTGMGGLIHDSEGRVLLSFFGVASFGSINMAELETMYFGFLEARRMDFQHIAAEGNSLCD